MTPRLVIATWLLRDPPPSENLGSEPCSDRQRKNSEKGPLHGQPEETSRGHVLEGQGREACPRNAPGKAKTKW